MHFKQENESLIERISFLENNSVDEQKDDNLQTHLDSKYEQFLIVLYVLKKKKQIFVRGFFYNCMHYI